MKSNSLPHTLTALALLVALVGDLRAQTTCYVTVNASQVKNPHAQKLLGLSFDGRSSMDFDPGAGVNPAGYYDPATGDIIPAAAPHWNRMPMKGTRYPGNLVTLNWNWSYTVGPVANRIAQPMGINGSLSQILQFGFDEYMDMVTLDKGLPASDVQIMVNIYPSVGQSNPGTLAADWVEYCNAPNNGSNPRGGPNWAAMRASYGHSDPYNIRIWNIGNEPWSPGEYGSTAAGANNYIAVASPIIDSMLAVDPAIDITIPAVGNGTSAWNSTIMTSSLIGRIYGLSPHAFYDEDASTTNPTVAQVQASFTNLAAVANTHGLKIVAGDHAHNAPNGDPDKAMRWQGALATTDYLVMLSQISNIELSNLWITGNTQAQWHPIRKNAPDNYTLMAVGQLYEALSPVFYDNSLLTSVADSVGGSVPSVRAAAFTDANGQAGSVVIVNTHLSTDRAVSPPVLSGLNLQQVRLLTAPSINNDTLNATVQSPLPNGNYLLPHIGALIFKYSTAPAPVELLRFSGRKMSAHNLLEWATASERGFSRFEVERSTVGFFF